MKRSILAILLMLLPTLCYADDAKDVMKSLRNLGGVVAYGTSYSIYADYLAEARSEVELYLKGDVTKQNKKLRDAISEVIGLYEFADSLFCRIEVSNGFINTGTDASPIDKKISTEYFSRFPEDKKDVAEGGVLMNKQGSKLHIKTAVNKIFKRASAKYDEAAKLLN